MNKKHGGPAFPFNYHNQTRDYQECFATDNTIAPDGAAQYKGLSVRDYFAGQALAGLCANQQWMINASDATGMETDVVCALASWEMADQMLKAGGYLDE